MLEKIQSTLQTHWLLALIFIVALFLVVAANYKWYTINAAAKRKAAKARTDGMAKVRTDKQKKRKKQTESLLRWTLSIGFLVLVLLGTYLYGHPFGK